MDVAACLKPYICCARYAIIQVSAVKEASRVEHVRLRCHSHFCCD